jgi:hypothetical protein
MVIDGLKLTTTYKITMNPSNIIAFGRRQKKHINAQIGIGEIKTLKNVDIFPPFQTQRPKLIFFENEMQINPIWQASTQRA